MVAVADLLGMVFEPIAGVEIIEPRENRTPRRGRFPRRRALGRHRSEIDAIGETRTVASEIFLLGDYHLHPAACAPTSRGAAGCEEACLEALLFGAHS